MEFLLKIHKALPLGKQFFPVGPGLFQIFLLGLEVSQGGGKLRLFPAGGFRLGLDQGEGFFLLRKGLFALLQLVIAGQQQVQFRNDRCQLLLPGPGGFGIGESSIGLRQGGGLGHFQRFLFRQGGFRILKALCLGQGGGVGIDGLFQLRKLGSENGSGFAVLFQDFFKERHDLGGGELPGGGSADVGGEGGVRVADHALDVLADALDCLIPQGAQVSGAAFQPFLEGIVEFRAENVPENGLPLRGAGLKEAAEFALGDHGDLGELLPGQADDVVDGGVDLLDLGDGGAVGQRQQGVRRLPGGAGAPGLGPLVFGIPADGVAFAAVGEGQLHVCGVGGAHIFGAEHVGLAAVAAGLAVEGEGDGVENGGLACAGVAGDQVQAPGAQSLKIQLLDPGVGAEAGHGQFQRSHTRPS